MPAHLSFFSPQSIAVVGASTDQKSYSSRPLANLRFKDFAGRLYPINPKHSEIDGLTCYPDIRSLPEVPDLAIFAISATRIPGILRHAGELGVKNAIVLAGGFKEAGNSAGENEIIAIADQYGIAVLGPNCTGMMNVIDNVPATSSLFVRSDANLDPGPVAIVTQSGGTGISLLRAFSDRRIGLGYYLSVGNEACLTTVDWSETLMESDQVRVIGLYSEGLRSGRALLKLGRTARDQQKSLVVYKAGRSQLGQAVVGTHTGALAGPGEVLHSILTEAGIIDVGGMEEFVDVLAMQAAADFVNRSKLAAISTGGGFAVMIADACDEFDVPLVDLSEQTTQALTEVLPAFASRTNPVDMTPIVGDAVSLRAIDVLLRSPESDCVLAVLGPEDCNKYHAIIKTLVQATDRTTPLVIGLAGVDATSWVTPEAKASYAAAGVPIFPNPIRFIRAFGLARLSRKPDSAPPARPDEPSKVSALSNAMSMVETVQLLADSGMPLPQQRFLLVGSDLKPTAAALGFPLVLKGDFEGALHKTELGAVRLGIEDADELERAQRELTSQFGGSSGPLKGFLLQQQAVGDHIEVLIGGIQHPEFGPVITVGTGGVLAEIAADVNYGIAPVDASEALSILSKTRVYKLLTGYRGKAPSDVQSCLEAILSLSRVLIERPDIKEIEVNPLFVFEHGSLALDARAIRA